MYVYRERLYGGKDTLYRTGVGGGVAQRVWLHPFCFFSVLHSIQSQPAGKTHSQVAALVSFFDGHASKASVRFPAVVSYAIHSVIFFFPFSLLSIKAKGVGPTIQPFHFWGVQISARRTRSDITALAGWWWGDFSPVEFFLSFFTSVRRDFFPCKVRFSHPIEKVQHVTGSSCPASPSSAQRSSPSSSPPISPHRKYPTLFSSTNFTEEDFNYGLAGFYRVA